MVKKTKWYFFFILMGILSFWKSKPMLLSEMAFKNVVNKDKVTVSNGTVDFRVETEFENAFWYC